MHFAISDCVTFSCDFVPELNTVAPIHYKVWGSEPECRRNTRVW